MLTIASFVIAILLTAAVVAFVYGLFVAKARAYLLLSPISAYCSLELFSEISNTLMKTVA